MADDPRRYVRIHAELAARIADSSLPSGTLLNIGSIADEYGVARETVSRAIHMLADEELVKRYPGLGWQVE